MTTQTTETKKMDWNATRNYVKKYWIVAELADKNLLPKDAEAIVAEYAGKLSVKQIGIVCGSLGTIWIEIYVSASDKDALFVAFEADDRIAEYHQSGPGSVSPL